MKPLKIAFGIGCFCIVVIGGFTLKSKLDYQDDGREIVRLVAEYKSLGIPTTVNQINISNRDQAGAWNDLKEPFNSVLFDAYYPGPPNRSNFNSIALLYASQSTDLLLIQNYLTRSRPGRFVISDFVRRELPLVFPRHIFGTPPKATNASKYYVNEFLIAAYADSLARNKTGAMKNLEAARYLANSSLQSDDHMMLFAGTESWRMILKACLRIVEASPMMARDIEAFLSYPDLVAGIDQRGLYEINFVQTLMIIRLLDSPLVDRARPPTFLRGFIKTPTKEDIFGAASDKKDDYIPQSATMRRALREKLTLWKPVLADVVNKKWVSEGQYQTTQGDYRTIPSEFSDIINEDTRGNLGKEILSWQQLKTMISLTAKVLNVKIQTGSFPKSFAGIADPVKDKDFAYRLNSDGFGIDILWYHDGAKPYVHVRLTYPAGDTIQPETMTIYKDQMDMIRAGKLKFLLKTTFGRLNSSGNRAGPITTK